MAIFAILSKDTEELIFDQLCYNGEKYGKLLFWSYLPSWAKLRIKWYLAKFATLSKTVANDYFDHICHTEQRYGRSDNLTSFTTLGDTQIKLFPLGTLCLLFPYVLIPLLCSIQVFVIILQYFLVASNSAKSAMQTDFSTFSYFPRIFWFRDILSKNRSLVQMLKFLNMLSL